MTKNKKNKLIFIIIIFLLLAGIFYFYKQKQNNSTATTTTTSPQEKLNLDPPTENDKQNVDNNKNNIVKKDETINNQNSNTNGAKKDVKPSITYAGFYGDNAEVGAYVSNIFEDGGACTASFSKDNKTIEKKVNAVKNVSSVDCPVMIATRSELGSTGTWTVKVSYSSPTAYGVSDSKTFEVK